jgi:C-5 cytosine-specific DNA methylase
MALTDRSESHKPLAIDLFCGLGGWTEGLLAEGYYVVGFDNVRHVYGEARYPGQLVIQDVLTLHGAQFKDAALIVASPPCQAYSYRAMPWKRAKALPPPDNTLFDACFRIQREASAAAGRPIPLVVENVRGAQKWVGRARWNYGSFYLWGDVPALMPMTKRRPAKIPGQDRNNYNKNGQVSPDWKMEGLKVEGHLNRRDGHRSTSHLTNPAEHIKNDGGDWFGPGEDKSAMRHTSSRGSKRKQASALIAKIPLHLARHIARVYYPIAKPIG